MGHSTSLSVLPARLLVRLAGCLFFFRCHTRVDPGEFPPPIFGDGCALRLVSANFLVLPPIFPSRRGKEALFV